MRIGEKILDHYTKYLGEYAGSDQYRFGDQIIQILGFPNYLLFLILTTL